jgi:hypothetical protein
MKIDLKVSTKLNMVVLLKKFSKLLKVDVLDGVNIVKVKNINGLVNFVF